MLRQPVEKRSASQVLLSVIIPTLNEENSLPETLASLPSNPVSAEYIIVDGGSTDATRAVISSKVKCQWLDCPVTGRAEQMNYAVQHARGEVLLFLHADVQLPADAFDLIRAALTDTSVVGGGFCLRYPRRHWVLALCALGSRINHPLTTYGDQGLFMRRDVFECIGGFREWPIMEDLEIQFRLVRRGSLVKLQTPVISSDRRFRKRGPFLHELCNIVLVVLYFCGVSPRRLAVWYRQTD